MSKTIVYPDPNGATTIGASVSLQRVSAAATGVNIVYNPANGDTPLETTMAAALSAGARTNLAAILAELDAFYKTQKGYT
jgi:hypothetical protein